MWLKSTPPRKLVSVSNCHDQTVALIGTLHSVWNTHARIDPSIAQAHIDNLNNLTPPPTVHKIALETPTTPRDPSRSRISIASLHISDVPVSPSPLSSSNQAGEIQLADLDTLDELAIRALLLGINYRTIGAYQVARGFFVEAHAYPVAINTWVGGIAMFELAVLDLKEAEARTGGGGRGRASSDPNAVIFVEFRATSEEDKQNIWREALTSASEKLEVVLNLAGSDVDLSSRLDSRVSMLRDEIAAKQTLVGVSL